MLDVDKLDELYLQYGFRRSGGAPDYRVYTYRDGYFHNADIVAVNDSPSDDDYESLLKNYSSTGYACTPRSYASIDDAGRHLFDGFFNADSTRKRLTAYYKRFVSEQSDTLGFEYKYLPCPYTSSTSKSNNDDNERTVTQTLVGAIRQGGARLVLVEAAAGFGKTCTAYDLLGQLLEADERASPLFTELARNRQARVFRYVLLDEIDRNYPTLSSELVISEIQSGRIPLIIDGFDELLQRKADFDVAESMLETIGEILQGDAKVVLTTRRTAVFAGDEFHEWMDLHARDFDVVRVSIRQPSIPEWLGADRYKQITRAKVPINGLANPVLLSFLRAQTDEQFEILCSNPDDIVSRYMESLLEREQTRQALAMSVEDQLVIFRHLASDMVDQDFTSESREYVKELIIAGHSETLERVRRSYGAAERPSIDRLGDILAGHALLDRVGSDQDTIGFINDFILGTLVAENICAAEQGEWAGADIFVDKAITAYSVRSPEARRELWEGLALYRGTGEPNIRLDTDCKLLDRPGETYTGCTFDSIAFTNVVFPETASIQQSVFHNCSFTNCELNTAAFNNTGFLNCAFFDSTAVRSAVDFDPGRWILGCTEEPDGSVIATLEQVHTTPPDENQPDYRKRVLGQFWPVGRSHATTRKNVRTLFLGTSNADRARIAQAIAELKAEGLIEMRHDIVLLSIERIADVRSILGR